ncbi:MAG: ArdC-like ssDNA-binding domain-containing protein [Planctomycetales bacterium]|nr:ArdC-like ssDNA-binding domain-containing protein [Planctomycetales bacterium]
MQSQTEIRQSITNRLVAALKSGTDNIPWRRPWATIGPRLPTNHVTGRAYGGINVLSLWCAAQERHFPVDLWGSFNQWKSIGCSVKRGAKAERIVFYSQVKKRAKDENGVEKVETFPILKTWSVFNISEVEGEAIEKFHAQPSAAVFETPDREEFDKVVSATGADIRHGGDRAFYKRLPEDFVQMPFESQFHEFSGYAESLGHELLHWSEHRTGWAENYAFSELRAEIGACFLSTNCGIPVSDDLTNHQSYLASWLEALERDERFLFRASSGASKGVDFILSFSGPQEEENDSDVETYAVGAA